MINDPLTADINPVLDNIMHRIGTLSYPKDEKLIRSASKSLLECGWLPSEIVEYQKCTESVDNSLDEDVALARMRAIAERVSKRTSALRSDMRMGIKS